MFSFSRELEERAEEIRRELGEKYNLSRRQRAAIPVFKKAVEGVFVDLQETTPLLFDVVLNEDEQRWLEQGPQATNLEDALKELKPGRIIKLTPEGKNLWDVHEGLADFFLRMSSGDGTPFDGEDAPEAGGLEKIREQRRQAALNAYRDLCVILIEDRNKSDRERGLLSGGLALFFPVPADDPQPKPRDAKAAIRRKPKGPGGNDPK